MIPINLTHYTEQDKIDLFRKVFQEMTPQTRKAEIQRANRILEHKPMFILESPDGEHTVRVYSVDGIREAVGKISGKRPDISSVYKLIKGKTKNNTLHGVKVNVVYENEIGVI